jgi:hypothetical protein
MHLPNTGSCTLSIDSRRTAVLSALHASALVFFALGRHCSLSPRGNRPAGMERHCRPASGNGNGGQIARDHKMIAGPRVETRRRLRRAPAPPRHRPQASSCPHQRGEYQLVERRKPDRPRISGRKATRYARLALANLRMSENGYTVAINAAFKYLSILISRGMPYTGFT